MPRPPSISYDLMATLVTVVQTEGDAAAAAEVLHINQPSMSKRLAFLQHAGRVLRRPWIERAGKSWQLTDEGRKVFPAVEELVHRYRLLTEAIEETRPALAFGCGAGDAAGFVRAAVGRFRKRHPSTTYRMTIRPVLARVECVANGSLDMACVCLTEQEIQEHSRRPLIVEDLFDDPLVLAASAELNVFVEFQALNDRAATPKALASFPLILPEPESGIRREFDRRCRDMGIAERIQVVAEVGPWPAMLGLIRDGVGIGVIPRSALTGQSGLTARSLPPKLSPPNTTRLLYRKRPGTDEPDLSEEAAEFVKALREAAKTRNHERYETNN